MLKIKKICPTLTLHTHIIVGFPSETEQEFEDSLNLVRDTGADLVKIYGYSKNYYLTDTEIVGQEVPKKVIQKRIRKAITFMTKNKIACATA